jgi:hypothetical protein
MTTIVKEKTAKQIANEKKVKLVLGWLLKNAHVRPLGKQTLIAKKDKLTNLEDVLAVGDRSLAVWFGKAKRHEAANVCDFDVAMWAMWPETAEDEDGDS